MNPKTVGTKIRQLREHFDISQKQATALLDKGVSHSAWAYWEGHGCPTERLADIANMTTTPEEAFDWLTNENSKMPSLTLTRAIPEGAGYKMGAKKKKTKKSKKSKSDDRRTFTPQDRANIIAMIDHLRLSSGLSIKDASEKLGVWQGAYNKWGTMELPAPNGAAVPGVPNFTQETVEESPPQSASRHTTLPQEVIPKKKAGMTSAADKLTPMPVLVMRYQCPRCGQNLILDEE